MKFRNFVLGAAFAGAVVAPAGALRARDGPGPRERRRAGARARRRLIAAACTECHYAPNGGSRRVEQVHLIHTSFELM